MDADIADTVMERPVGFEIKGERFFFYPLTLGKSYLVSRVVAELDINKEFLSVNPCLEALRLCRDQKDTVCRLLALHSLRDKDNLLNEAKVEARMKTFRYNLSDEELAQLLVIVLSGDNVDAFKKHIGLDKEDAVRKRIQAVKEKDRSSVSFGGRSVYGTLIDFACQRYGWTFDYVVWGISYANLRMLMADAVSNVYLSEEERKKLRIFDGSEIINGDDPANKEKIKALFK